jgi:hypothetical protein
VIFGVAMVSANIQWNKAREKYIISKVYWRNVRNVMSPIIDKGKYA